MDWWRSILPVSSDEIGESVKLKYQGKSTATTITTNDSSKDVMLVRNRLSRIYFNKKFFDYPLKLNLESLKKLGLVKTISFGISYMQAKIYPIKPEISLQDFLINRFGKKLYLQFFKEYTEKVWGVSCSKISAEWGAQRIKSLSILSAIIHALKTAIGINNKKVQTSLIEHFIYPKLGPGQMWEKAAQIFIQNGGKLLLNSHVHEVNISNQNATSVKYKESNGETIELSCTHLISTMPIKDLIEASKNNWDPSIKKVASDLQYRDFITVGLLYKKQDVISNLLDNWIYIQEPGVQVGRVQIFNNWSPYLVADKNTIWLGLEFFCTEGDSLWNNADNDLMKIGQQEMIDIGLTLTPNALDAVVIRVPKAYPGYFGDAYKNFNLLKTNLDSIKNLFLIGRNGMHRYNNQDHSMLTAKEAADQIALGLNNKEAIWNINVDDEYHEESK
jgi:protoporphyrinogen oxidase